MGPSFVLITYLLFFQETAINGDHLWVSTSASGDLCYVGESECSVSRFVSSIRSNFTLTPSTSFTFLFSSIQTSWYQLTLLESHPFSSSLAENVFAVHYFVKYLGGGKKEIGSVDLRHGLNWRSNQSFLLFLSEIFFFTLSLSPLLSYKIFFHHSHVHEDSNHVAI